MKSLVRTGLLNAQQRLGAIGLFLLCLSVCINACSQTPQKGVIVPGKSVAGLTLDSTLSQFFALFPKHVSVDEDYSDTNLGSCPRSYHWVDLDRDATGVYALLKDNSIFQLSIQTPRFTLKNGIGIDTSATTVQRAYPIAKKYVLRGSGSDVVGGKDLHYWIDSSNGIAFELYWNKRKQQRLVSAIAIFHRGATYLPDGCISPPQQWQEISPSTN